MAFFIPALLAGISAIGGGLANRSQTSNQRSTSNTTSSASTNPVYGETELDVRNNILRQLLGATEQSTNFVNDATTAGIQGINQTNEVRKRMIESMLTGRGLSRTSAGVSGMAGGDFNRQGQINQLIAQAPFQQEQIRSNRLQDLSRFFSTLPVGTSSNQTSNSVSSGTSTTPNNALAGGLQSGSSIAAMLYGMGAFK